MTIKTKTKILASFLEKACMSGKQAITEAVLNFEESGLMLNANSLTQQGRTTSCLKKEGFLEYEPIGKVPLNNIGTVILVLKRFGEIITLKKEGNLLNISSKGKKVDIELIAENLLSTDTTEPNLEFTDTFIITATKLKEVFKDVSMNKDSKLTITTEEKKVIFTNTGKYKFQTVLEAPTCKGGAVVTFGEPLIESTINLDGTLEISVATDYPAKITEKTDTSVITIIAAPRVVDE